ncbi:uncharacterized protein ACDP82_001175 [Pangshura tecta]
MDPAQLNTAIVDVLNTSRTFVQYMVNQDLQSQARRRRRLWQRGDDSDEDVDTEFFQTAGPCALEILMVMGQVLATECRFWAHETSTDWWDCIALQVWDDSQWLRNFRMRKGTFMELCDLLSPALKRQNTKMRAALTVEKRVAIALWKLATPDSYWSVGNQFGVGKSTVGAAVMQVAKAIFKLLLRKVVTLGNVTLNDITLLRITQRDKERMFLECQQSLGPYAAMLCHAMIPDYLLHAWRGKVSYHGGRNKAALPRNLLQRFLEYLQERFIKMSLEDFRSIPRHVNKLF